MWLTARVILLLTILTDIAAGVKDSKFISHTLLVEINKLFRIMKISMIYSIYARTVHADMAINGTICRPYMKRITCSV